MDADVIVVGAGAVGLAAARRLAQGGLRVHVVEKEAGPGLHQSGRNSGVLHAGYNLRPGSLKARYCVQGNREAREYCRRRGVPLRQNGILVVAAHEQKRPVLAELHRRALLNGVQARLLDGQEEIAGLEPHARGVAALHAPEGASIDARAYVHALAADAAQAGAVLDYDTRLLDLHDPSLPGAKGPQHSGVEVRTSKGRLTARVLLNAAGLHADRVAGPLARGLRVVPFRGFYAELAPRRRFLVRAHVYAAPDLELPFLGVHFSRRTDGRVLVGPGAMLALGREAYSMLEWNARDALCTLSWPGLHRLLLRPGFGRLVAREASKGLRLKAVWREAAALLPELRPGDLVRSYAGNRAQLVDRRGNLVDDLEVRCTDRAVHVLNAVSPGLTCSLPFGDHLAQRVQGLL